MGIGPAIVENHAPVQRLYDLWLLDSDLHEGVSIAWLGLQGRTIGIYYRVAKDRW